MKAIRPFVRASAVMVVSTLGVLLMLRGLEAQAPPEAPGDTVPPGNAAWGQVVGDGFGNGNTWHIGALEVFSGSLYAGTSGPPGSQLWRTGDLLHWSNVVTGDHVSGFGFFMEDMAVFEGRLYAATRVANSGSELWASADGVTWSRVVERNGLGPLPYQLFAPMQVFSDHLYVNVYSYATPEGANWIWRTADGAHWEEVSLPVPGGDIIRIRAMAAFDGHLYAAGYVSPSQQIWRTDGISWTAVMTDGFGGTTPWLSALEPWAGNLYALGQRPEGIGTWRSPDGIQWTAGEPISAPVYNVMGQPALAALGRHLFLFASPEGGLAAWRSSDGVHWQPIGSGGFGDRYNVGVNGRQALAPFDDKLLVGTLHFTSTGGQVWQYLADSWYLPAVSTGRQP